MQAKPRGAGCGNPRHRPRAARGHYWVPHWYKAAHHVAFWNKFAWPAVKPKYERGIIHTWWYDRDKAAKLTASR